MTIVLRDGLAVANTPDPMAWLLKHCPYSTEHALQHEGYSLLEDGEGVRHNVHQAWVDYLGLTSSAGLDVTGLIVHTIERVQALTLQADVTSDTYLAQRIILPMLQAIHEGLNYLTGSVAAVAGELSTWAYATARRWGLPEDAL